MTRIKVLIIAAAISLFANCDTDDDGITQEPVNWEQGSVTARKETDDGWIEATNYGPNGRKAKEAIKEELRSQIDLLPDKEKRILLLIDGKRLIKEIVEKSGFLESEVYEILYSFAMNDIVLIEKNIYDNITFL